jgi:hypothetical protein
MFPDLYYKKNRKHIFLCFYTDYRFGKTWNNVSSNVSGFRAPFLTVKESESGWGNYYLYNEGEVINIHKRRVREVINIQ